MFSFFEKKRWRNLVVPIAMVIIAGCANVKILRANVVSFDPTGLVVELVTNEDVRQYDDTIYANRAYLSYRPANTVVSSAFANPGRAWKWPFAAAFGRSEKCGSRQYCSRWTIPMAESSNLDLRKYQYVLRPEVDVRLRIGGGSMIGGRLSSNAVVVRVP